MAIPASSGRAGRESELAVFERVATGLAVSPGPASVSRALVEALRTEMHVERAAVYVLADDRFELLAHAGFPIAPVGSRPVDAESLPVSPTARSRWSGRHGPIGFLLVDAPSADRMTPSFLRAIASTMATALGSSRLLVRARRELRRARALRSVTKELTGTLELGSLLGEVVELTRTMFDADKAGLWLVDEGEHPFKIAAHHGLSDAFLERVTTLSMSSDTIGNRAVRERRPYSVRNADTDRRPER